MHLNMVQKLKVVKLLLCELVQNIFTVVLELSHWAFTKVVTHKAETGQFWQLAYLIDVFEVLNLIC